MANQTFKVAGITTHNGNSNGNSQNTEITDATETTQISKKRCWIIRVVTV